MLWTLRGGRLHGWAITGEFGVTGAAGTIYDSGQQETVQATAASTTSGPGTLSLSSALTFGHATGTMVTTLPQSVIQATILFSAAHALSAVPRARQFMRFRGRGRVAGRGRRI